MLLLAVGGVALLKYTSRPRPSLTTGLKIAVVTDGIYRLSAEALRNAGLAFDSLAVETVHLSTGGQPIPYLLQDEALFFYGQASDNRYSAERVYILQTGAAGHVMAQLPAGEANGQPDPTAAPRQLISPTLHLEENLFYEQRAAGGSGPACQATPAPACTPTNDVWFWRRITSAGQESRFSMALALPTLAPGAARLQLQLYGLTHDPKLVGDHDFSLLINDQLVADVVWDGQVHHTLTLPIPDGVLQPGDNTLLIDNSQPGAAFVDQMQLNWVALTYPSYPQAATDAVQTPAAAGRLALSGFSRQPVILDITHPEQPRHLSGWGFADGTAILNLTDNLQLAAAGPRAWREPVALTPLRTQVASWFESETSFSSASQADMLVVTTAQLAPALAPLVAARAAEGLRSVVVDVADLYDVYTHGEVSPDAIQAFVQQAVTTWAGPKPRYLFLVGEATTDPRGYLAQRTEDAALLPRNHVPSPFVLAAFGGETVSDARLADSDGDLRPNLAVGRWPMDTPEAVRTLVERTLAYEQGAPATQAIFTFDGSSQEFALFTEQLLTETHFPTEQATLLAGPAGDEVAAAWNAGAWLISYVGHGSQALWGKDEIFSNERVSQLEPLAAPPIVTQFTCLSGQFADPYVESLSETLLRHRYGPVLVVSATSLTLSNHQAPFAAGLVRGLQDPAIQRIGDALQQAKEDLDTRLPGLQEISDTFGLLGDPSAHIVRPAESGYNGE